MALAMSNQAINIEINSTSVLAQLREIGQDRQGPFILSRSLNLLGKAVQTALRDMEATRLNLRRRPWVQSQVMITRESWSTKTKLSVTIALSDAASFMSRLETGETKTSRKGKWLMVPSDTVFRGKIISKDDPLNLHALNLHRTPHGLQGNQRTFMIKSSNTGTPLVLQRVAKEVRGKGRRGRNKTTGTRILYYGIRSAHIPHKMAWYDTAAATVQAQQYPIFTAVIKKALSDGKR